jgi:hypothetical protein
MRKITPSFSEKVKRLSLLWSDRHCCICGKSCGLDIEVAHIDQNGGNGQDNAIPVCFKHHADLGRYNDSHPRGNKYEFQEIKKRREQIYERYTRNLIPGLMPVMHPTSSEIGIQLPTVVFTITPVGRFIPVKARIVVNTFLNRKNLGEIISLKPYYSGGIIWHLNPGKTVRGNFVVPEVCVNSKKSLQLELNITIIDPYEREHKLLPVCFTFDRNKNYWFLEPTSFSELRRYIK